MLVTHNLFQTSTGEKETRMFYVAKILTYCIFQSYCRKILCTNTLQVKYVLVPMDLTSNCFALLMMRFMPGLYDYIK